VHGTHISFSLLVPSSNCYGIYAIDVWSYMKLTSKWFRIYRGKYVGFVCRFTHFHVHKIPKAFLKFRIEPPPTSSSCKLETRDNNMYVRMVRLRGNFWNFVIFATKKKTKISIHFEKCKTYCSIIPYAIIT